MENKKHFLRNTTIEGVNITLYYTKNEDGSDKELILEREDTNERISIPCTYLLFAIGTSCTHFFGNTLKYNVYPESEQI